MIGAFSKIMNMFQTKIILLVLAMLILSQSLGTLLSVLSFEKVYVQTLTSKYELLGKDIKRKIEQSLKFGKSLDMFMGMDRLINPLFEQAPELAAVMVMTPSGEILFPDSQKENVHPFIREDMVDWENGEAVSRVRDKLYHVLLPIVPPMGGAKGILDLIFSKSLVDSKTDGLIRGAVIKLVVSLIFASVLIGVIIKFMIIGPFRNQLMESSRSVSQNSDEGFSGDIPEEIHEAQFHIADFVGKTSMFKSEFKTGLAELSKDHGDSPEVQKAIAVMSDVLREEEDEKD